MFTLNRILLKDIDENLQIKANEIANILRAYEKINQLSSHPLGFLEELVRNSPFLPDKNEIIDDLWRSQFESLKLKNDYISILNIKGRQILHSNNINKALSSLILKDFSFSANNIYFGNIYSQDLNLRVINFPYSYKNKLTLIIQVATSLNSVNQIKMKFILLSVSVVFIVIVLTSFLGSFFVRKILTPVQDIINTANKISHKDLSIRIKEKEHEIEMQSLIGSFNSMIERLEKSFGHINEFNSHVAHELKTPLAIMRGELELSLEQLKENDENKKLITESIEEIDRMIRIVKDLLFLAKLDFKPNILKFEELNLNVLLEEILEHSNILASEKSIFISFNLPSGDIIISADKVHLRRLFLNIIVNAISYSPNNSKIILNTKIESDKVFVEIIDHGKGISPENISKVFDKFFRIEKEEQVIESGSGLGLSIALSIAKAHQGDILVQSKLNEGSVFTIVLPVLSKS